MTENSESLIWKGSLADSFPVDAWGRPLGGLPGTLASGMREKDLERRSPQRKRKVAAAYLEDGPLLSKWLVKGVTSMGINHL